MNIPGRTDKRGKTRERGATLMEFALILPVFVLLVFGLIEFGHTWYITHAINSASREGARHGIRYRNVTSTEVRLPPAMWTATEGDLKSVEARVKTYLKNFFDDSYVDSKVTVEINNPLTENDDLIVTVTAPKPWPILGPLIGLADTNITAVTTMRLE